MNYGSYSKCEEHGYYVFGACHVCHAKALDEVERLRAQVANLQAATELLTQDYVGAAADAKGAALQLAAANALLERVEDCRDFSEFIVEHRPRIQAHLAGQTTAPDYDPIACPITPGDFNGPHARREGK